MRTQTCSWKEIKMSGLTMKLCLKVYCLGVLIFALGHPIKAQQIETRKAGGTSIAQYIDLYKEIAISEMRRTKIPASITLAQGIIESKSGNSYLAVKARNHFGIKCHKGWKGMRIFASDDEEQDCFRKYKSAYSSYIDHSNFLVNHQRYSNLFRLNTTDYVLWAKGLKEAGYATELTYANQLITTIEAYQLHRFDHPELDPGCNCAERIIATPMSYNGIKTVFFDCKVTPKQVEQAYKVSLEKLARFNRFGMTDTIPAHTIVYLQAPKNKTSADITQHVMGKEETFQSVANLYGIKTNSLYRRNRLDKNASPKPGETVYLRGKKSRNTTAPSFNTGSAQQRYVVKSGDTLFALAQRFSTTVDTIKRANKLRTDTLQVGQKLKIIVR